MYLCKLKNGYYYIFYIANNGKKNKISARTKRKSEAIKFLAVFQEQIKQREKDKFSSKSLKTHIWEFLKYSEVLHSLKTTRDYKTTFNFFQKFIGDPLLSDIKTKQLSNYLADRISKSSVFQGRKDLINLSRFFNKAFQEGFIPVNPCSKLKRIKIPEKQPLFFSEKDFKILFGVIDRKDFKDIITVGVFTGMRQAELINLQWNQINWSENLIVLDNHNHITKSKKIRTLPLNNKVSDVLKERLVSSNNNLVFTYNGSQIKPDLLQKWFKKYVLKAELNPKLHFHSLRHSFASWLIRKNVPIYQVSKLLGHQSIKTTEIYAHLTHIDLYNVTNLLNFDL